MKSVARFQIGDEKMANYQKTPQLGCLEVLKSKYAIMRALIGIRTGHNYNSEMVFIYSVTPETGTCWTY